MTSATKVRITEQRHDTDNGPEGAKGSAGSEAGTHHRALRTCSHIGVSQRSSAGMELNHEM